MKQRPVITFSVEQYDKEEEVTRIVSNQLVKLDISSILEGPLMDLAASQLASALDEMVLNKLDVEDCVPDHRIAVRARLYIQLCYELLDTSPEEVASLQVELPDSVDVLEPAEAVDELIDSE